MGTETRDGLISQLKVLLVEDEECTREELGRFLKKRVGRLFLSSNGEEGLRIASLYHPDIVVADLRMPVMDGLQMCRRIKEQDIDCAFIIVSALSDVEIILQAVDIGIVKYLIKPIDPNELLNTMARVAKEIWKTKIGHSSSYEHLSMPREERLELENKCKKIVAYFLKSSTGKGPRDVQVFIGAGQIEVRAFEVLTPLEQSLLTNSKNGHLVEYLRRTLYLEKASELESAISQIINVPVKMDSIKINALNNQDYFVMRMV